MTGNDLVLLGVIGRAHGIRGQVRVRSHTADPNDLARYGPLRDGRGGSWELRWRGEGVAELKRDGRAVTDRTEAVALNGTRLYVRRADLPPPDEDEFYLADLVGLPAHDGTGAGIGTVTQIHEYGAGTSLEVARPGLPPLLLPFTRACVPVVDLAGRRLVVAPPAETE